MSALPWWLKWLVLPVVGLFVLGSLVVWILGMVVHALFYIAVGAVVFVALMWTGRRIAAGLRGGRRRGAREVEGSSRRGFGRSHAAHPEPGTPDYLREFRDLL